MAKSGWSKCRLADFSAKARDFFMHALVTRDLRGLLTILPEKSVPSRVIATGVTTRSGAKAVEMLPAEQDTATKGMSGYYPNSGSFLKDPGILLTLAFN